jgi:hypothetical protein
LQQKIFGKKWPFNFIYEKCTYMYIFIWIYTTFLNQRGFLYVNFVVQDPAPNVRIRMIPTGSGSATLELSIWRGAFIGLKYEPLIYLKISYCPPKSCDFCKKYFSLYKSKLCTLSLLYFRLWLANRRTAKMSFSHIFYANSVMGRPEKNLICCGGQVEWKKFPKKTAFTSSMALRRSNFTPARAKCGPD